MRHHWRVAFRRRDRTGGEQESLFDATKVDLVTLSPDHSLAQLYIVNESAWTGSDAQISSLQEKIHNYVSFAVDGQMASTYPETRDLRWTVVIDDQAGAPDSRTAQVIAQVADSVRLHGGDLVVR